MYLLRFDGGGQHHSVSLNLAPSRLEQTALCRINLHGAAPGVARLLCFPVARQGNAFQGQQGFLGMQAARKPCQLARGADHAVAGGDDGNGILAIGGADGAHGGGAADLARDLAIAARLAKWYGQQRLHTCCWNGVPAKSSATSNCWRVPAKYS